MLKEILTDLLNFGYRSNVAEEHPIDKIAQAEAEILKYYIAKEEVRELISQYSGISAEATKYLLTKLEDKTNE